MVEGGGRLQAVHVEVDVPENRTRRRAGPRRSAPCRDEVLDVQRIGRHHQLLPPGPPAVARPVGVDLDPQAVGVGQVQRLAHQVIGHPRVGTDPAQMGQEPAERGAVRKQDRKMVKPQPPAPRHRRRARVLAQFEEGAIVTVTSERGSVPRAFEHPQAENLLVVGDGSRQVRHLEHHAAEASGVGQAVAAGWLAVGDGAGDRRSGSRLAGYRRAHRGSLLALYCSREG